MNEADVQNVIRLWNCAEESRLQTLNRNATSGNAMLPNGIAAGPSDGFEGAIAGLGLSDVIQLNTQNRFSGCIAVHYQASSGLLFFREGELIHAEQGARSGEDAFHTIMQWPGGRFNLQPNVATTSHTIRRSTMHLLIDAHRLIDERRAGREPASASPDHETGSTMAKRSAPDSLLAMREIRGVSYAVRLGADGTRVGDDSYEAETLEGQVAYLDMLGKTLGAIFGAGDPESAVVQGRDRSVLLLETDVGAVGVAMERGANTGAIENEIRRLLSRSRNGREMEGK